MKKVLEQLMDSILMDISEITDINKKDVLYSGLAKLYLPSNSLLKNIILELYTGDISLNEAYARVFEFASRNCKPCQSYLSLLNNVNSLHMRHGNFNEPLIVLENTDIDMKQTGRAAAKACRSCEIWESSPEYRIQFINLITGLKESMEETENE